jgi:hypothetical protein
MQNCLRQAGTEPNFSETSKKTILYKGMDRPPTIALSASYGEAPTKVPVQDTKLTKSHDGHQRKSNPLILRVKEFGTMSPNSPNLRRRKSLVSPLVFGRPPNLGRGQPASFSFSFFLFLFVSFL